MSLLEQQASFYRERVPEQFNETIARQERLAENDPEAQRLLGEMRSVRTLIRVEVETEAELLIHLLEIDAGTMHAVESATNTPFFVLRHALDHFENLSRRCGTSVLGFLGALTGLGHDMKLTSQRVRSLRALEGCLDFQVEGKDGFSLIAAFGTSSPAATGTSAAIRLTHEVFEALKNGELEAQDAFFEEKIAVEGDMGLAIGAALAALSPE